MTSRKIYEAVAAEFKDELVWHTESDLYNDEERALIVNVLASNALRIARVFEKDNPNFDRLRFLRACGLVD